MEERIAICEGLRTPFAKVGGSLADYSADELGALCLKELLERSHLDSSLIDEVIIGNVAQPAHAANIARVIALKANLPEHIPAYTVHRNCASGMESLTTASQKILSGQAEIVVAGGTESMSNIPFLYSDKMKAFFEKLFKAKRVGQKMAVLSQFRLHFLKPVIGVLAGLTDPVCGLVMGLTAENLAKEFKVNRDEQDRYALQSHQKAVQATQKGILQEEIMLFYKKDLKTLVPTDEGPRTDQSLDALRKLRPYFDRRNGTVTVGNACPLTDGAAMTIVMKESKAKDLNLPVLGYIRGAAYAGLEPERMGLGPVYASSKVLSQLHLSMKDIDLVEINEAFSAQILANLRAFSSDSFARKCLGKDKAVGEIDPDTLNVNGGAIALGHPVGTSGTRIILTLLKELRRRHLNRGLATLCIGGGQGGAVVLEVV